STGPANATSATAAPSASATMHASTPCASGAPSPASARSSSHPASRTAPARRLARVPSSRSATVAGPSSPASCRAERRSSACSGVSRVSTASGVLRAVVGERIVLDAGVEVAALAHERGRAPADAPAIRRAHVLVVVPSKSHGVGVLVDEEEVLLPGGAVVVVELDDRHVADELPAGRSREERGEALEGV